MLAPSSVGLYMQLPQAQTVVYQVNMTVSPCCTTLQNFSIHGITDGRPVAFARDGDGQCVRPRYSSFYVLPRLPCTHSCGHPVYVIVDDARVA